jgi:hypothetical protein
MDVIIELDDNIALNTWSFGWTITWMTLYSWMIAFSMTFGIITCTDDEHWCSHLSRRYHCWMITFFFLTKACTQSNGPQQSNARRTIFRQLERGWSGLDWARFARCPQHKEDWQAMGLDRATGYSWRLEMGLLRATNCRGPKAGNSQQHLTTTKPLNKKQEETLL